MNNPDFITNIHRLNHFFSDLSEEISSRAYIGNRLYVRLVAEQFSDNSFNYRHSILSRNPSVKYINILDNTMYFIIDVDGYDYRTPASMWHKVRNIKDLLELLDYTLKIEFFTKFDPISIQYNHVLGTIGSHGLLKYDNDADIAYIIINPLKTERNWYVESDFNESFFLRFILDEGIKFQFDENSSRVAISIPNVRELSKGQVKISLATIHKEDIGFFPLKPYIYHLELKNRNSKLVLSFGQSEIKDSMITIDSEVINNNKSLKEVYFDRNSTIVETNHKLKSETSAKLFVVDENISLITLLNERGINYLVISIEQLKEML